MYFASTIVFIIVTYIWETYLSYRQHKKLKETEIPSKIKEIVSEEKFLKARAYGLDKSYFSFVKTFVSQLENGLILKFSFLPFFWSLSKTFTKNYLGYDEEYEVTCSLVFITFQSVMDMVISFPFDYFYTFVVEEKHGFNKQTFSLFMTDKLKMIFFSAVLGLPMVAGFLHVIKWGGEYFYIYVCVFVLLLQLFLLTIYPVFIQPCFNKVEKLPDGELRSEIEVLAKSIDYPLKKLYQIDGSKRSGHSNAYMYGFCNNKQIVLFDTLIKQSTVAEVCAVLGHELGHWKLNHTIKMMVIGQLRTLAQFWLFGQIMYNKSLFLDFGFEEGEMPTIIGLVLFGYINSPIDSLLGFVDILITRMHEFQADAFAVNLGKGKELKSGLIKLQIENLGNMNPDKWYSTYHYSHPPLVERLEAIDMEIQNKTKKTT